MGVTKFKPASLPRALDTAANEARDKTQKTMWKSRLEVARSKDLIKKSQEILAATMKRRVR